MQKNSILLPLIQKKIEEKRKYLVDEKIVSWIMMFASGKGQVENFYGKKISYSGIKFEGTPQQVFWGKYIEPFLESHTEEMILLISDEVSKNKLNLRTELDTLSQNLRNMFESIYDRMAEAEQQMLGEGVPGKVKRRKVFQYVAGMNSYLDQHIAMALDKNKSRTSLKNRLIESFKEQAVREIVKYLIVTIVAVVGWVFAKEQLLSMFDFIRELF